MENLEELSFNELKAVAKKANVAMDKTDTMEILKAKIKDNRSAKETFSDNKKKVVTSSRNIRKVIITKLNPEDTASKDLNLSITNMYGSKDYFIKFNTPMMLPVSVINNLKSDTFQGWETSSHPTLGTMDTPSMRPKYNVQYLD